MKTTYDAEADAAYTYLSDRVYMPETPCVHEDINLDFNEDDQLVGIEILSASERLQIPFLMPYIERIDTGWAILRRVLAGLKKDCVPVETLYQHKKSDNSDR